jgi:hypothetical protein
MMKLVKFHNGSAQRWRTHNNFMEVCLPILLSTVSMKNTYNIRTEMTETNDKKCGGKAARRQSALLLSFVAFALALLLYSQSSIINLSLVKAIILVTASL